MKETKENKSVLEESLQEYKSVEDFIKNSTDTIVNDLISEKVKNGLKKLMLEDVDDDESEENDITNIEDGSNDISTDETEDYTDENNDTDILDTDSDIEGDEMGDLDDTEGEEDFDLDSVKVGDDEYDLTNSDIDDVVKVFKKVGDEDNIVIKKEGDKIELTDNDNDTEYVIDLGELSDEEEITPTSDEDDVEDLDVSDDDEDIEIDLGDDDESEEELDLDDEDNLEEKPMTQSIGANRRAGRMTQTRQAYAPGKATNRDGSKLISKESKEYNAKLKLIEKKYKSNETKLLGEIDKYKQVLGMFRDKLKENAVLSNSLAKYVKIITENATTKDEKLQILKRFSTEANTIEAGNKLYESVVNELSNKTSLDIDVDQTVTELNESKKLNEQVIYQSENNEVLSFMNRMNNLYK